MNVLLVDDDQSIIRVLSQALAAEGVEDVRVAQSGTIALDTAADFQPDVIILDYWMPVMDGESTAKKLRELCPGARIIAFSGALEEKPEWADDFYVKGDLPDLHRIIHLND
jgi:two-component system response regulator YesN